MEKRNQIPLNSAIPSPEIAYPSYPYTLFLCKHTSVYLRLSTTTSRYIFNGVPLHALHGDLLFSFFC